MIKILSILMIIALCVAQSFAIEKSKPNVIIIYADDLGYGDISAFSNMSKIHTPNLDKLAKDGISFSDAHTVSSVCTPSRYGLLTGEYSWKSWLKSGVLGGFSRSLIPQDKPTIATMMRKNGYRTACIGKWHLGMKWQTKDGKSLKRFGDNVDYKKPILESPLTHGFDYFYGIAASLDMSPFLMIENDRVVKEPNGKFIEVDPKTSKRNKLPFCREGDYVIGEDPETFMPRLTAKAKEKIAEFAKSEVPFFIYFPLTAPHTPVAPNDKFKGQSGIGDYGDFVLEVDDTVGQIIQCLKEQNIYNNTIVIFSSDNGPETGAYQRFIKTGHASSGELKGVKRDLWEGGHRVPFIFAWKGMIDGDKIVNKTICLSDAYATLCDVVGYTKSDSEAADSFSLIPLIEGKDGYMREHTIHHSCTGRFAVRKGDWVLIEGSGNDNKRPEIPQYYKARGYKINNEVKGELFNISGDIQERKNVYDKYPEKVKELTSILDTATANYKTKRGQ